MLTTMVSIVIDPDFAALIPPLEPNEIADLERNLLAEGCRDPLVVWNGVLIDGHHRHAICTRHRIPFQVIERQFETRQAVEIWMIRNQLGRRNLTSYQRSILALRCKATVESKLSPV